MFASSVCSLLRNTMCLRIVPLDFCTCGALGFVARKLSEARAWCSAGVLGINCIAGRIGWPWQGLLLQSCSSQANLSFIDAWKRICSACDHFQDFLYHFSYWIRRKCWILVSVKMHHSICKPWIPFSNLSVKSRIINFYQEKNWLSNSAAFRKAKQTIFDHFKSLKTSLYQLIQVNLFIQTVLTRSICYREFPTGSNSQHQAKSERF